MATKTKKADRVERIVSVGGGFFEVSYTSERGLSTLRRERVAGETVYQDGDVAVYSVHSPKATHVNGDCHVPYDARALVTPDGTFAFHQYTWTYPHGRPCLSGQYWGSDLTPTQIGDYWYVWFMGASEFSDSFLRLGPRSQAALKAIGVQPTGTRLSLADDFAHRSQRSEYIDLP